MATPNLSNKIFMLDIETTGVDPRSEEVLQIAIVEMDFVDGLWSKGRTFNFFQNTQRQPNSKFALEHMQDLYKACREKPFIAPAIVRQQILQFFSECSAFPPNIFFCGWNAGIFDIPFLAHHGYLVPAKYEGDKLVGDCHYRVYELSGAIQFYANLMGTNEVNPFIKEALKAARAPKGNKHDALYDCERQIAILNGLLILASKKMPVPPSPVAFS